VSPDGTAVVDGGAPTPARRGRHAGVPLHSTFDTIGPEGGPAIVFLHGTRLTRAMWRPQRPLAERFRLVMADLPGHGSLAAVRFTLPAASDHVHRVIDAAIRGRAVVVGQSLGGYVAMDLAARHPEQVRALVLCNCTQEPRTIARTAPRVIGGYLLDAAAHSWRRGRDLEDGPGAADLALVNGAEPPTEGWLFRGGTRALVSSLGLSFIPRLRAFAGPTLIINGAGDRLFRRGETRFLAAATDGRLVIIDGAHHVASEEAPEVYNAIVRGFVEELDSR
jgi:pimeloyl-ACP methyl ester carboxylesterase